MLECAAGAAAGRWHGGFGLVRGSEFRWRVRRRPLPLRHLTAPLWQNLDWAESNHGVFPAAAAAAGRVDSGQLSRHLVNACLADRHHWVRDRSECPTSCTMPQQTVRWCKVCTRQSCALAMGMLYSVWACWLPEIALTPCRNVTALTTCVRLTKTVFS